jgi:oxygen-dependent protoporphyrinogen oxidase
VIVGGGVCGLVAAYHLRRHAFEAGLPLDVTVVEAAPRLGGKIVTEHSGGFVVEGGPDSFLAAKPQAAALARALGLGERLVGCDGARRRVWVARRGRLAEVPPGLQMLVPTRPRAFLASPLFSWPGKARIALERWLPPRPAAGDESLAGFVRRRFGREALERLADPVLSSIHLGDPERLSLAAVWPGCAELERRHGSVGRGVRAAAAATGAGRTQAGGSAGGPATGEPAFLTLRGGLAELIDALAERLGGPGGAALLAGRPAVEIAAAAGGGPPFTVRLADGETLSADAVLLAVPAFAAADLLAAARPELAAALGALRYASAATVALGFPPGAAALPEGFGFFVPAAERRAVVAATFASTKFPGRAPAGGALVRAFVGGARGEAWAELPEDELVAAVRADLAALIGLAAEPALARVHRWPRGYPQYEVGHRERVAALEAHCGPGLYLAGSAYHGAGIPDTVASAERAAAAMAEFLAARAAATTEEPQQRRARA